MDKRSTAPPRAKRVRKILIIGRTPPPVGGITTHVKRLTENLKKRSFDFTFCDLREDPLRAFVQKFLTHKVIHIHFSRPCFQLTFAILCRLAFKRLIITYHGQWGRYNKAGNYAVSLSAALASVPIVQDDASFRSAMQLNNQAKLISTFISSPDMEPLPENLTREIIHKKARYEQTFCTNAWNVTFDKAGRET